MPKVWYHFRAFIVDERYIFVCRYVELFQSYMLPIDGGSLKFEVLPAKFFKGG